MIDDKENCLLKLNSQKTKTIAVWGSAGSGKSCFTTQLGTALASIGLKVLVADFNTVSPSLDHYFGISKHPGNITFQTNVTDNKTCDTSLSLLYDLIERDIFEPKMLAEVCVSHSKYDNLHILTGNYQLGHFEMLNTKHFENIINSAKKVYDVVLLDTNSMIFVDAVFTSLQKSDIIVAITEADYTRLREVNNTIDYLSSFISKDKFKVVINKYTKKYLDNMTVNQILEPLKVLGFINYNEKYITSKIDKKPFILGCKGKEKSIYFDIARKLGVYLS